MPSPIRRFQAHPAWEGAMYPFTRKKNQTFDLHAEMFATRVWRLRHGRDARRETSALTADACLWKRRVPCPTVPGNDA